MILPAQSLLQMHLLMKKLYPGIIIYYWKRKFFYDFVFKNCPLNICLCENVLGFALDTFVRLSQTKPKKEFNLKNPLQQSRLKSHSLEDKYILDLQRKIIPYHLLTFSKERRC